MKHFTLPLLLLAALALAGCGRGHEDCCPLPEVPDWSVTVATTGGLCAGSCDTRLNVSSFGAVTFERGAADSEHRELPKAELERLDRLVREAQRSDLTSGPFTGTCPIAFDGQQRKLSIQRKDGTPIQLDSCADTLVTEAPLLVALDELAT